MLDPGNGLKLGFSDATPMPSGQLEPKGQGTDMTPVQLVIEKGVEALSSRILSLGRAGSGGV